MRKGRIYFVLVTVLLVIMLAPVSASAGISYTNAYKSKKRYIVTCNHHYDNKYNTLAKYDTVAEAKKKIQAQRLAYRGQWYVWDSVEKVIAWPDLSTDAKKIKKIAQWAAAVGNDPRHGYDTEGERKKDGCSLKYKRWGKCGDYGCSPLVETPFELFGFFNMRTYAWNHKLTYYTSDRLGPIRGFNANNTVAVLKRTKKFKNVTAAYLRKGRSMLRPGDIVINTNQTHTAIIVSSNRIVEGNLNERGLEFAPSIPGDQRGGTEIYIHNYMSPDFRFFRSIGYVFRPVA